jgi:menaquinone-dependent protoporphyrinogen oxidase
MRLLYASRDGQARRIAMRIADRLAERGIAITPRDLAIPFAAEESLAGARVVVVVAAGRYGRHLPEAEHFFSACRDALARVRLVFVSVNLSARKAGNDTAVGNRYLRKSIARHRLEPALATAVAGRLDYKLYGWLDRQIIRCIMKLTGGPTDPRSQVEFTAWAAVDTIAERVADLHGAPHVGDTLWATPCDRHRQSPRQPDRPGC